MAKDFCPFLSADNDAETGCDAACSMRFAEPATVYANRCEVAAERGDPAPERDTFCAMAVMAEASRKQSPCLPPLVTALAETGCALEVAC